MNHVVDVLLIEEQATLAHGIKYILEQNGNYFRVNVTLNGDEGLKIVQNTSLHLVMLDLIHSNWKFPKLLKEIRKLQSNIHVIIFTDIDYTPVFTQLLNMGIDGILHKNATPSQLIRLLECVMDGQMILPQTIINTLNVFQNHAVELSDREKQILSLVSEGFTNIQIAEEIYVSCRSVENYLTKIYKKLKVQNRKEAVEKALQINRIKDLIGG